MTAPRRRVLRPAASVPDADSRRQTAAAKRLVKLAKERELLQRWMSKLRRAFHAVETTQRRIGRLERCLGGDQTG